MMCHGFKGGIGTASRVVERVGTVGVLVQANHGRRDRLRVNGVPVGELPGEKPAPGTGAGPGGSIIVIVATDAALLPGQCDRLAQRAALGIGRVGGAGEHSSGDIILAFATGNRGLRPLVDHGIEGAPPVRMAALPADRMDGLFYAVIEATEEAIVNALIAGRTMTGRDGNTVQGIGGERLAGCLPPRYRLSVRGDLRRMRRRWSRPREVAGCQMRLVVPGRQVGVLLRAHRLRDRAAGVKPAARAARRWGWEGRRRRPPTPIRGPARAVARLSGAPACTGAVRSRTVPPSRPSRRSGRDTSPRRGRTMWRTTAISWAMKSIARPSSPGGRSSRLTTCACTETSSADTGSSATRSSGSSASARAMRPAGAGRPRTRADSASSASARRPTWSSSSRQRASTRARGASLWTRSSSDSVSRDGHPRVERRVRVLEHHLHPPPLRPLPLVSERSRRRSGLARAWARPGRRCSAPGGLATAGLADEPERLAAARRRGRRRRRRAAPRPVRLARRVSSGIMKCCGEPRPRAAAQHRGRPPASAVASAAPRRRGCRRRRDRPPSDEPPSGTRPRAVVLRDGQRGWKRHRGGVGEVGRLPVDRSSSGLHARRIGHRAQQRNVYDASAL